MANIVSFKKCVMADSNSGGSIVTALQIAQAKFGYIHEDAVAVVAKVFGVSTSHVYSIATFYGQFTFAPQGRHHIQICTGTACYVLGAQAI